MENPIKMDDLGVYIYIYTIIFGNSHMFFFGNYKIWFHVSSSSPEPFFSLQRSGEPKHKKVCNRIDGRQRYEKF